MSEPELFISIERACLRLSISRMTFYRLVRTDRLKTAKIGRRRLVSVGELARFAARTERDGGTLTAPR